MKQIVDFHVHAGNFPLIRKDIQDLIRKIPLEPGIDVEEVFSNGQKMEAYLSVVGVTKGIVLAECGPGTNYSITSEMIADHCKNSTFLIPFGSLNPEFHQDIKQEFEHSLMMGVKGFKFYPADHNFNVFSDTMMEVYHRCEKEHLIIMFHTGFTAQQDTQQKFCNPADFTPLLEACPTLPVIFCHAGKPHWYDEAIALVKKYDNAYIDTALVPVAMIKEFVDEHPDIIHKIIFGSDWPVCGDYHKLLERYADAGFSDFQLEQIMFGNGYSLLKRVRN